MNKKLKSELRIAFFIILVIAGVACTWVIIKSILARVEQNRAIESTRKLVESTRKLVDSEAKHYLSLVNKDEEYVGKNDAWGRSLEYEGSVEEDYMVAAVRSAGPDGVLDSPDDIVTIRKDLNKSKLVGKWAGKRIKEATSGFWQGLKSKTDFKKK